MLATIAYVDGFNLYYRLLKQQPCYRWLDVACLADCVTSKDHDIHLVNYYTARVSAKLDPEAPRKQQLYLSALSSNARIKIHTGNFLVNPKWVRPFDATDPEARIKAIIPEEKGSDVNLASHLVRDACQRRFEAAAIFTNDTDFVEPIRIVTQELGMFVVLCTPVSRPARSLVAVASSVRHINNSHLRQSQLPNQVGKAERPPNWT